MTQEINLEQCLRFLAEYGASKNSVAKVLGMPMEDFLDLCRAMPDAKWKPRGQTIGDLRALRKRKWEARKRRAKLEEGKEITLDSTVTVFGHTGTIREIADKFAKVHRRSVLHRLRLGLTPEEAIFNPTNRGPAKRERAEA